MKVVFIGANNPETLRVIKAVKSINPEFEVIGFIDNDSAKIGKDFVGLPVLGNLQFASTLISQNVKFTNLITRDTKTRHETSLEVSKIGGEFTNFIHPSVNLLMVKLGVGNYFQENVVVQANVQIGNNSSIHIGSLVGHETKIGHSVFIAHGCNISGLVNIEDGVWMGTGVSTVPKITIGKWSIVGAGTVITKDVPPYSVIVGNPGRVIKQANSGLDSGDII